MTAAQNYVARQINIFPFRTDFPAAERAFPPSASPPVRLKWIKKKSREFPK